MVIGFYTRDSAVSQMIRWGTWKPERQAWSEVPSHCAVLLPKAEPRFSAGEVIEAVEWEKKVIRRPVEPSDSAPALCRRITVPLPLEEAANNFLVRQVGKPYDFPALLYDALGFGLAKFSLRDKSQGAWDCSRLVAYALQVGGYPIEAFNTRVPISPNDLWLLLQDAQEKSR